MYSTFWRALSSTEDFIKMQKIVVAYVGTLKLEPEKFLGGEV